MTIPAIRRTFLVASAAIAGTAGTIRSASSAHIQIFRMEDSLSVCGTFQVGRFTRLAR